jgi:hypothetical protein
MAIATAQMILAKRGQQDFAEMYRAFRGRDPIVGPLLRERGLTARAPRRTRRRIRSDLKYQSPPLPLNWSASSANSTLKLVNDP